MKNLISKINPANNEKYHKKLFSFLSRNHDCVNVYFYRKGDKPLNGNYMKNIGNIIIGVRSGNKCIRGQYLNNINSGRKGFTKPWFFCSPKYDMDKFEDITDEFWDQYLNKGICLFSKHNEEVDSNQRYIYTDANTRKCKYCGLIQVRKKKKVTVYKDYWSIPKK